MDKIKDKCAFVLRDARITQSIKVLMRRYDVSSHDGNLRFTSKCRTIATIKTIFLVCHFANNMTAFSLSVNDRQRFRQRLVHICAQTDSKVKPFWCWRNVFEMSWMKSARMTFQSSLVRVFS